MAQAFRRKGTRIIAYLDQIERETLSILLEQTRQILEPPAAPPGSDDAFTQMMEAMGMPDAEAPAPRVEPSAADRDPALGRLLPRAHRGDDEIAAEFRRLSETSLRQRKVGNLQVAIDALAPGPSDRVDLDARQAQAFVMALTDVRLLFAERIGLHTEQDVEDFEAAAGRAGDEDPIQQAYALYDFLTWLQETLTQSLMGR